MRALASGWVFLLMAAVPFSGAAQDRQPIIDVHMHANVATLRPDGTPPPLPCPNSRLPCGNAPSKYQTSEALLQGTLEYMKRFNIVRGVVSGAPSELPKWKQAAPGRFVLGAGILGDPAHVQLDSLRTAFERGDYAVLGEVGTQYAGMPPNDSALTPYFALAERLNIPVWIHTAGIGAKLPRFRVAAGNPLLLEDVLKRHPRVRLYVENAGYPFLDEMVAILYMYPNVYVDVSTITWLIVRPAFHDYLRRLVVAGFADRIMFGSDQMSWPEAIELAVRSIESADFLSPQQRRDIFFNNAVRFFGWDEQALLAESW